MGRTLIPRYLAALELSTIDDADLHELAANIVTSGKTSPIVLASTTLQATVADLATSDANLTTANKAVDADRNQLRTDIAAEAQVRSLVVGAVRSVVTAVTNVAKSPADLHAAGLPAAPPRPAANQAPTVPGQLDVTFPRTGHGKARVTVSETGTTRHDYAAQQSADGTTWTQLGVGHGKTRTVTGASGTKVWVRFAMVRGQLQSDWSTPVLVTIP
jgi:hypothetical protein